MRTSRPRETPKVAQVASRRVVRRLGVTSIQARSASDGTPVTSIQARSASDGTPVYWAKPAMITGSLVFASMRCSMADGIRCHAESPDWRRGLLWGQGGRCQRLTGHCPAWPAPGSRRSSASDSLPPVGGANGGTTPRPRRTSARPAASRPGLSIRWDRSRDRTVRGNRLRIESTASDRSEGRDCAAHNS